MKRIRIGSGSAYWGDMLEPAVELVEKGDLDYIGFDHLAELTLAILQRWKARDPNSGYIPDIVPWMKAILPRSHPRGVKVITNAGGANPEAAADQVIQIAKSLGYEGMKVGIVTGDDIFPYLDELRAQGIKFPNLDTGEEDIDRIRDRIVAANAYIGADHIIEALREGCEVVVTGRVSDNALYVGPIMYEFGWEYRDPYWDLIGAAVTIGHIIECAECVCGGMSNMWREARAMWEVGFPIAEVYENGECIITKVPGSGGIINEWTVKEHLVYEVHDPANYLMPDGIADFTSLRIEEVGQDRVKVTNMKGKPRPDTLKVCIGYQDGWIGEGLVLLPWPDALEKARRCEEIVRERLKIVGVHPEELLFEYIGVNALHGSVAPMPKYELNEVGLRIAAKTRTREEAEAVRREATHLWTIGGLGCAFGVPLNPRPVVALWPTLVPRDAVKTQLMVKEVR